ncbi:terminase large subunit [Clostridium sp. Sa3CUN1]|uniref:Terminase large subunit n=1 Tax=Clostridium gallinarum TaxID=2762246 RepID=A0ABR8Q297_9CLOT|nr:terminase TerL endonuclease subunit [Clostridium gallinarum]MBD7914551.1 terminase large subunit [Clostridium gallinarum]
MIKYPDDYNPILEYWNQIENKEIVVCNKLYRTYKKVINDLNNPGEFFYSHKRGNHIIEFIENFCRHSKGKMGGKPVILELWEKAMLATIFGFINIEGIRKYQFAELIIAKKNGKSLLSSCVGLYLQVGDGEAGPEVYSVATKKDQAKIIWQESKRMVKKSPTLRKRIKTLVSEMDSEFNDGVFKPLASDSDSLDGLNVHGALMDEIHQWKNGKALYDIIADGVTAREQPLIFVTTTAGTIREDIYDMKYDEAEMLINGYDDENGYKDERSIYFIYELDNRSEWIKEECWQKANPGLGTIKNSRTLKEKVEKAKKNPLLVKNLLCKEFNIRETSSEAWLNFEQINNINTFDIEKLKPRYGIGGADLSSTTDLTCATIIFKVPNDDTIYVMQMYFLPEDLLEKRVQEDKIPYDIWRDLGLLRTTPGNRVDKTFVTEWFLEIQNEYDIYIYSGGYDAWSAEYWVQEMKGIFGKETWEPVYQGKKTLSGPMKALGADLEKKVINYNNNPILKWCLTNTAVDFDKNDNIQPIKTSNQRRRIDGLASLLNAYVQLERVYEGYMSVI